MRARMRTVYTMHIVGADWRGDCPRWADEGRRAGLRVTETRVLWVGKPWPCAACTLGRH